MYKKILAIPIITLAVFTACVHNQENQTDEEGTATDEAITGETAADGTATDEATTDDTTADDSATSETADDAATDANTTVEGDIKVDVDAAIGASADAGTDTTTDQVNEISVIGDEFSFAPSSISVKAGEKVKINFKNEGNFPHNIAIEELALASSVIGAGETTALEFTAPAAGTYTVYCSVAGHKEAGMEGDLISQ